MTDAIRTGREPPFPPPRFTGDATSDTLALQEWMKQVRASLIDSGLGDPVYQYADATIDKDDPPKPGQSTIARAQATANLALGLIAEQAMTIQAQAALISDLTARVTALETP